MNRKTEITKKSATNGNVKYTTTTTTWKSEVRSSSSSTSSVSSSSKITSKSNVSLLANRFDNKTAFGANNSRSTDATAIYNPVYPRTNTTALLGPTTKSLFYSFPKSPPEVKYVSPIRPQPLTVRSPLVSSSTVTVRPEKPIIKPQPIATTKLPHKDNDTYAQSYSKSKRLVYIMNHFRYNKDYQKTREGSWEDVKSLIKTFSKFNVTVKERHDQTKAEILDMARKQALKNYKGFDFIIYIIMTHGGTEKNLASRDHMYNLESDFIREMQTNRTWLGVPKVFIIQACRGDLETDAVPSFKSLPFAPNDTLKLFATYEGYVSYRTSAGTYFIQDLCSKINEFGATDELMTIMRRVTQDVSKKAPTPEQSSTLQKSLYLGKMAK